jgi:uncharacterized membrane protein
VTVFVEEGTNQVIGVPVAVAWMLLGVVLFVVVTACVVVIIMLIRPKNQQTDAEAN